MCVCVRMCIYIYISFQAPNKKNKSIQEDTVRKNNIYGNALSLKISRKHLISQEVISQTVRTHQRSSKSSKK